MNINYNFKVEIVFLNLIFFTSPSGVFVDMVETAAEVLSRVFDRSCLGDLTIVVFPTSEALCDFLGIKVPVGQVGGKAKGNHVFIVDHPSSRNVIQASLQHEICHVAFERVMNSFDSPNPWLNEGLALLAQLSFNYDRARRPNSVSLNGVLLRGEDFDIRRLDNLHIQNMNERTSQIMLAVSLLSFI